jgi:hypothetical protein
VAHETDELDLESPLPSDRPGCRLRAEAALTRARVLEGLADASWERLPFDSAEAPEAVLQAAEAQSCYQAGHEREAARRVSAKGEVYAAELRRRWSRAKLLFALARRGGDALAQQREIKTLLALSRRAGAAAEPYRAWLEHMERDARRLMLGAAFKEN